MEQDCRHSAEQQEWRTMRVTEPVPEAVAQIRLPLDQLRAIPEGLEVSETRRHARATVRVVHDTLLVAAHCDSMERKVDYYATRALEKFKQENRQERKVPHHGGWGSFMAVLLCLGLLIWLVGRRG